MLTQEVLRRQEYLARINRVIDYIEAYLSSRLTLEELAAEACFSRFHFHRIFSALVCETLADYIRRARLERTAMRFTQHPKDTVTDIALDCGSSCSGFSTRALKRSTVLGRPILRRVRSLPSSTCWTAGSSETRCTVLKENHGDACGLFLGVARPSAGPGFRGASAAGPLRPPSDKPHDP